MANKIKEEDNIEFTHYDQLSFKDEGASDVELYVDGKLQGEIEVWKDSEMGGREYICINYSIVYLDSLMEIDGL